MHKRLRIYLLMLTLSMGMAYLALSILVHQDVFRAFDYDSMVWLQSVMGRIVDIPFSVITLAGSAEIISLVLAGVFIFIFLFQKKIFFSLVLYFLVFVIEIFGKIFIYHPVPPSMFHRYALGFSMPSGSLIDTSFSYPSGHMARTVFLAVIFIFLILYSNTIRKKKIFLLISIFILISIVFISRIYLGEHWFSDVLGGFLLGGGLAALSLIFW